MALEGSNIFRKSQGSSFIESSIENIIKCLIIFRNQKFDWIFLLKTSTIFDRFRKTKIMKNKNSSVLNSRIFSHSKARITRNTKVWKLLVSKKLRITIWKTWLCTKTQTVFKKIFGYNVYCVARELTDSFMFDIYLFFCFQRLRMFFLQSLNSIFSQRIKIFRIYWHFEV